ncbi:hypothetical protein MFIFM68171_00319 [Madurella fahalii]|uniref:Uncharacterized protein n=1 Tax=Madurella fahalii TaxID=1157608 RepID=A0ABQ0FXG6_9PEZI
MTSDLSRTQTDVSTLSLGAAGTEPASHHTLSPPSPGEVGRYESRPLPPVPNQRHSLVSTLSKEMNEALATPDGSIFNYRQPEPNPTEWEKGEAEIAVILDKQAFSSPREKPKLRTTNLPTTPPNHVISPQPRSSVRKAERMTGRSHIPALRETRATLHRPDEKIHSIMGGPGDIDPQVIRQQAQIRTARREQRYETDDTSSTSPLSITSSAYSQGTGAVVSELESAGADAEGRLHSSDSGSNHPSPTGAKNSSTASSSVPEPLRIVKSPERGRNSRKKTSRPPGYDEAPPWLADHPSPRAKYNPDPYHQVQVELAWDDRQAARNSPRSDATPPGLLYSRYSVYYTRDNALPSSSNGRLGRACYTEGDRTYPVSSRTFGRPHSSVQPPYSSASSSPESGALCAKFEYDWYNINNLNFPAIGAHDTGSSIPNNDTNMATSPTTSSRYRTSFINLSPARARAFFRRSGITSNPPATPTPTPTSVAASIPIYHQHPRAIRRTKSKTSTTSRFFPYPTRSESVSAPVSYASFHSSASSTATGTTKASNSVVKGGMSALSDLVGLFNKSVMSASISGDERRRQKLKSSIRVLADGAQVFSPPGTLASDSPLRSRPEPGSVSAPASASGETVGAGGRSGRGTRTAGGSPAPAGSEQGGRRSGGLKWK